MGLTDMYNAFKSLDMEQAGRNAIEQTKERMIYLNKSQLNLDSQKSDGKYLRQYFDREYAIYKHELNPFPGLGNPDLNLTGKFYSEFFATVKGDKIEFGSTDSKSEGLQSKYGKNIFGLTSENEYDYATETVRPKIVSYIEKVTGLKAT